MRSLLWWRKKIAFCFLLQNSNQLFLYHSRSTHNEIDLRFRYSQQTLKSLPAFQMLLVLLKCSVTCSEQSSSSSFSFAISASLFSWIIILFSIIASAAVGRSSASRMDFLELTDCHAFGIHHWLFQCREWVTFNAFIPEFFWKTYLLEAVLNDCVSYIVLSKH